MQKIYWLKSFKKKFKFYSIAVITAVMFILFLASFSYFVETILEASSQIMVRLDAVIALTCSSVWMWLVYKANSGGDENVHS